MQIRLVCEIDVMGRGSVVPRIFLGTLMVLTLFLTFPVVPAAFGQDSQYKKIERRQRASGAPSLSLREEATLGKGDLYALVVGVANYKNPNLNLKVSDNDAKQFAEFLKTQEKVFRNTYVNVLVNQNATKLEIEKALTSELLRAGKDDTVIVFLSGHGSGDPKKPGEFFFLGYDADPKYLEATAVKMSGLDFLKRIDSQKVLVVADACHAGTVSEYRTKSVEKDLGNFARQFSESTGRVVLTSCKPDELSQEKPGLNNSVFTYYLLKGLNGEADTRRVGVVSLNDAYEYVYEQTKNETGGAQHPQLAGTHVGSFPISVLGKVPPMQLEASFIAQDPRCTNKLCTDPPPDVTVCDDPMCKDVELRDGSTMHSGQNYQIAVRPSSTSYVYVYQIGTDGDLYRLFPDSEYISPENKKPNPLKGGEIYWIPAKDAWLRLDDQQGKERIYVVASRSRNQALEDLYGHLEKLRNQGRPADETKTAQTDVEEFLERTMAPTKALIRKVENTSRDRKIRSFEELRGFFESPTLDAVRSVWFDHRRR